MRGFKLIYDWFPFIIIFKDKIVLNIKHALFEVFHKTDTPITKKTQFPNNREGRKWRKKN